MLLPPATTASSTPTPSTPTPTSTTTTPSTTAPPATSRTPGRGFLSDIHIQVQPLVHLLVLAHGRTGKRLAAEGDKRDSPRLIRLLVHGKTDTG